MSTFAIAATTQPAEVTAEAIERAKHTLFQSTNSRSQECIDAAFHTLLDGVNLSGDIGRIAATLAFRVFTIEVPKGTFRVSGKCRERYRAHADKIVRLARQRPFVAR